MISSSKGFLGSFMNFVKTNKDDIQIAAESSITTTLPTKPNNLPFINKNETENITHLPNTNIVNKEDNTNKLPKAKNKSDGTVKKYGDHIKSNSKIRRTPSKERDAKRGRKKLSVAQKYKKKYQYSDDSVEDDGKFLDQDDEEWSSNSKRKKYSKFNRKSKKKISRSKRARMTKIDDETSDETSEESDSFIQYHSDSSDSMKRHSTKKQNSYTTKSQNHVKSNSSLIEIGKNIKFINTSVVANAIIKSNPLLCSQINEGVSTTTCLSGELKQMFMPQASFVFDLNWQEPHSYQEGNFVVEKKEYLFNPLSFPLWRIDCGKILEKYERFEDKDKFIFQKSSTYLSWAVRITDNYKGVEIREIMSDKVELIDQFKPKSNATIVDADYKPLAFAFNVYMQTFLSQTLEPTFMEALFNEPDTYYTEALQTLESQVDDLLLQLRQLIKWTPSFLEIIEKMSKYSLKSLTDCPKTEYRKCTATTNSSIQELYYVRFYGYVYNKNSMILLNETEEINSQQIIIGKKAANYLPVYHTLSHIRLFFYSLCYDQILKVKKKDIEDDHAILDSCLQNSIWMQQMFFYLTRILTEAKESIKLLQS